MVLMSSTSSKFVKFVFLSLNIIKEFIGWFYLMICSALFVITVIFLISYLGRYQVGVVMTCI